MPNHVENIITLKGDEKRIREMLEAIKNDDFGLGTLDFNKIIRCLTVSTLKQAAERTKDLKHTEILLMYMFSAEMLKMH